ACRKLRNKGYLIALDGFRPGEEALMPLLDAADIVNIEFDRENQEKFRKFALELRKSHPQAQLLAKKLESPSEFELAKKCEFALFQGSFFSKPTVVKNRALLPAPRRHQTLKLMRLSLDPGIDYQAVSDIIKQDIALSYRLLRVVNSAFFGLRYTVSNIRQALSILGVREIKKWITLIALSGLSENKPSELITLSMARARFMELLAPNVGMAGYADDLFLMGLMSLMDAIMDIPMTAIVAQTNISTHIAMPLLTHEGEFGNLLNLIACYEKSDWDQAHIIAAQYDVSLERIFEIYMQAIEWAQHLYAGPARA
ncbi:MAG: HDOD domain-containing protein, partial [Acidobacteria bacterium]|nr:HDOD domain-containing protein [Acidobacteriota bacterium]